MWVIERFVKRWKDGWLLGRDRGAVRPMGGMSGRSAGMRGLTADRRMSGGFLSFGVWLEGVWGRREFAGTKEIIARIQRCSHPGCSGQLDVIQPSCVDGWCGILQWACREGEEDADE